YTPRPRSEAWSVMDGNPRAFAHATAVLTIFVARPFPRKAGSVYIERRYGWRRRAAPGRGWISRTHTAPPATISRAFVSATNATNRPDFMRCRAQRRYAASAGSRSSVDEPL